MDACPLIATKLRKTSELLEQDAVGVTFLAVSVDPDRDSVGAARSFAAQFGPPKSWYFLTGPKAELEPVWRNYNVGVFETEQLDEANHPETMIAHGASVMIIDSDGAQRLVYGPDFDPDDLAADLRLLMGADAVVPSIPFSLQ